MSVDVGSEARVAQPRKLRRFGWRVGGPRLPQTYTSTFIRLRTLHRVLESPIELLQSLSPFEKTLHLYKKRAPAVNATQVNSNSASGFSQLPSLFDHDLFRGLAGSAAEGQAQGTRFEHTRQSAHLQRTTAFLWRRHISSGVDQRWSLTPRATPSSRSNCAVYCRSSLMPSSP